MLQYDKMELHMSLGLKAYSRARNNFLDVRKYKFTKKELVILQFHVKYEMLEINSDLMCCFVWMRKLGSHIRGRQILT
jgi:hypothetical protein